MKNKKLVLLFLLSLFFIPRDVFADSNNLKNIPKKDMIKLTTKRILNGSRTGGASSTQGIEVTDKYIIITQRLNSEDGTFDNPIMIYDKKTLQYIKTINFNIGHGNDLVYNEDTDEIMFLRSVNGNFTLVVLDANTLEHKKNINLTFASSSFAVSYDKKYNKYYFAHGDVGYITDSNFNTLSTFDIAINQTRQSLEFYDEHLYYTNYEYGAVSQYEPVYDGVLDPTESVIYTFDKDGKYTSTLYIPAFSNHLEIEGTAIDKDGNIYFLFNNWTTNEFEVHTVTYDKSSNVEVTVPIKSEELDLDNYTFKANLYDSDNNLIDTYQTSNGEFKFTIPLTDLGKYTYTIKQVDIENKEVSVDTDPITITINSKYNLYTNKVNPTYTLSSSNFNNEKGVIDNTDDKDKKDDKEEVVKVPDLSSNNSSTIIIFGLISLFLGFSTIIFIYNKTKYNL